MAISFAQLHFAEPSPEARRMLWHILSIGSVFRDEPERREGLDKAGLFLFQVATGEDRLEVKGKNYPLSRGDRCWLVDLRHPRNYVPSPGRVLRTEGVRSSGPVSVDIVSTNPAVAAPLGAVGGRLTITFPTGGTNSIVVPIDASAASVAGVTAFKLENPVTSGGMPVAEFVFRDEQILRPYFANRHTLRGHKVTRNVTIVLWRGDPPRARRESGDILSSVCGTRSG